MRKLPQTTVEEIFRRFHAANPEPKGELQSVNDFTFLVAVVLSAQATDESVNKATQGCSRRPQPLRPWLHWARTRCAI
jgi:endonuclease III